MSLINANNSPHYISNPYPLLSYVPGKRTYKFPLLAVPTTPISAVYMAMLRREEEEESVNALSRAHVVPLKCEKNGKKVGGKWGNNEKKE